MQDPYLIPGTNILINKFNIQDAKELQDLESIIYFEQKLTEALPNGQFDYQHLKDIHQHLFGKLYAWAGQERTVDIAKGHSYFAHKEFIEKELNKIFSKLKSDRYLQGLNHEGFCKKLSFYFNEINAAHPFREGNGRTLRAFLDLVSNQAGYELAWEKLGREEYIEASISGFNGDYEPMEELFKKIVSTITLTQEVRIEKTLDPLQQPEQPTAFMLNENLNSIETEGKWLGDIVTHSIPVSGTLAEKYLNEKLGITKQVLTESFRFNPRVFEPETKKEQPALIIPAKNEKGGVQAAHCTYLDKATADLLKIAVPKRIYGEKAGALVPIQRGDQNNQFAIAENPESALSIAESNVNLSIWSSLGHIDFDKISIPKGSADILLCVNNSLEPASIQFLNKSISILAERGINVWCIKSLNCKDFNEVLKRHGSNEIERLINAKIFTKEALSLTQLIKSKDSLVSNKAKIVAEFAEKAEQYQKIKEPATIQDIEKKVALFEEVGNLSLLIKEDTILTEIAHRHQINKSVINLAKEYVEYQKSYSETKYLLEKMDTQDPIHDYLKAVEQKNTLPPSWCTQSITEKEQWNVLNDKIQKLAFIIDKNPLLKYNAKEIGIYTEVKKLSTNWKNKASQEISLSRGI